MENARGDVQLLLLILFLGFISKLLNVTNARKPRRLNSEIVDESNADELDRPMGSDGNNNEFTVSLLET